ncbi:MAG: hypothetical protein IT562_02150 [Alphaproteobacteria bacterium]|nr:hypothetical protein [Alphaproteobacteria bacterium]
MEVLYFAVVGIALYLLSDWLVDRCEQLAGRRFTNRTALFFVILLVLAVSVFSILQHLLMHTGT